MHRKAFAILLKYKHTLSERLMDSKPFPSLSQTIKQAQQSRAAGGYGHTAYQLQLAKKIQEAFADSDDEV